jgi:hypothetical protein
MQDDDYATTNKQEKKNSIIDLHFCLFAFKGLVSKSKVKRTKNEGHWNELSEKTLF